MGVGVGVGAAEEEDDDEGWSNSKPSILVNPPRGVVIGLTSKKKTDKSTDKGGRFGGDGGGGGGGVRGLDDVIDEDTGHVDVDALLAEIDEDEVRTVWG